MNDRLKEHAWFLWFLGVIWLVLLIALGLAYGKDSGWWAAWGQWVGGIGSIAAAWAAVWVALKGWRKSDEQFHEQANRQEESQQRDLASRFGVWIDYDDLLNLKVMVVNSGPLPIYNVQIIYTFPHPSVNAADMFDEGKMIKTRHVIAPVGPAESMVHKHATEALRRHISHLVVEAGGSIVPINIVGHSIWRASYDELGNQLAANISPFGKLEVTFSDSNGLRWRRTPDGRLTPFSSPID